jgi:hypothetical protein
MTRRDQINEQIEQLKVKECLTEWEHEEVLEMIEQLEEELFVLENS